MKTYTLLAIFAFTLFACNNNTAKDKNNEEPMATSEVKQTETESTFNVTPISHATMVLDWDGTTLYIDPVGGAAAFTGQAPADLILVTDIHGDHFNMETLREVVGDGVRIMAPQAVADKIDEELLSQTLVVANGETTTVPGIDGFTFEAIPMYNLREEALKFHTKGRGNGYVIEKDGMRVYISGDTEDIPEMRNLENIDIAFVCMNLPYTMTVESAASAVVDFKPEKVYPYHYRGSEGMSDVGVFRDMIKKSSVSSDIEVVQLDWYPNKE